jgi:uronate dehydrogenase
MLSTWLSPRDFMSLTRQVFRVPVLGCPVIYGVSANKDTWWDNHAVSYLGWEPQDSSETCRAEIEAQAAAQGQNTDSLLKYQGGNFALAPLMPKDD